MPTVENNTSQALTPGVVTAHVYIFFVLTSRNFLGLFTPSTPPLTGVSNRGSEPSQAASDPLSFPGLIGYPFSPVRRLQRRLGVLTVIYMVSPGRQPFPWGNGADWSCL